MICQYKTAHESVPFAHMTFISLRDGDSTTRGIGKEEFDLMFRNPFLHTAKDENSDGIKKSPMRSG